MRVCRETRRLVLRRLARADAKPLLGLDRPGVRGIGWMVALALLAGAE